LKRTSIIAFYELMFGVPINSALAALPVWSQNNSLLPFQT